MKKVIAILILMIMLIGATACHSDASAATTTVEQADAVNQDAEVVTSNSTAEETSSVSSASSTTSTINAADLEADYDDEDLEQSVNTQNASSIELNGSSINTTGAGTSVNGSVVTITAAGTYVVSGTLNDGQIIVDTTDEDSVIVVLNGVNIASSTSAPIYVANADKVVLNLAAGSVNTVTDGSNYVFAAEEDEPNAAVFSKDDLTINGSGSLTVNANYNNGIASKDDLKITGGTITVTAVNDGIKGRDSVSILDGMITINAGGDGIQANNDADVEEGFIIIEGGTLAITAGLDGIQAETNLLVSGGVFDIVTGGGSVEATGGTNFGKNDWQPNATQEEESKKGLKAGSDLTISGGTITISAYDDALHSNNTITIEGGEMELATGDDGAHADTSMLIEGGTINITQSYEGLESLDIVINDGYVYIKSSDDGINGSAGSGDTTMGGHGGFGGGGNSATVVINGGYVYMNASGDGLDSNGTLEMNGGVVLVNGPTNNGNGPLDYTGSFNLSGGILVAVGSSGMAQAPTTDSTQYSIFQNFSGMLAAGTLIHLETADGETILTYQPAKEYQSILISTPDLANGETYNLFMGGTSTGTSVNGLISDGTYSDGTQVASYTLTSVVTGGTGGGMGGQQPGDQPGGHPGHRP